MPRIATSDGAELAVEQFGQGAPVVILPGWTMTQVSVEPLARALAEKYQVTIIEARSHGQSPKTPHGHRIARYGRDVLDALEALQLENVILVGWSMAASTLLAYWEHTQGARARALVFVDFSPRMLNDAEWGLGFGDGDAAQTLIASIAADYEHAIRDFIPSMFAAPLASAELERFVGESLLMPQELAARILAEHVQQDWRDVLPTITAPALVAHGTHSYFPSAAGRYVSDHIALGCGSCPGFSPYRECPARARLGPPRDG